MQRESEKGSPMDVEGKMSEDCELNDKEIELQKEFELACEREWIEHAEINDVLHYMMAHLPQRCWLVLNDHHGVCEVCPLLTVHFLLGIPYDVVKRAFSPYRWGNQMQWPSNKGSAIFYTRNTKRGGLKLNYRQGTVDSPHAIWIWMDRSGAEPYRGPGDDYFKGHPFRAGPWHLHHSSTRKEILTAIESGGMHGCRGVPESGWVSLTDHLEQDTHPNRPEQQGQRTRRASSQHGSTSSGRTDGDATDDPVPAKKQSRSHLEGGTGLVLLAPCVPDQRRTPPQNEPPPPPPPPPAAGMEIEEDVLAISALLDLRSSTSVPQGAAAPDTTSLEAAVSTDSSIIAGLEEQLASRNSEVAFLKRKMGSMKEEAKKHQKMNHELAAVIVDSSDQLRQEHALLVDEERKRHEKAIAEKDRRLSEVNAENAQLRSLLKEREAELEAARSPGAAASLWASAFCKLVGPPARKAMVWSLLGAIKSSLALAKVAGRTCREVIANFKEAARQEREDTTQAAAEDDAVVAKLKERELPSLVAAMREEAAAAPLVDKSTGSFSPYDLGASVERKKSSAPLLWRLISAMILAPWEQRTIARMRRSLASACESTFRFGTKLLTKADVGERLASMLGRLDRNTDTVIEVILYNHQRGSAILAGLLQRLVVVARAGNGITAKKCSLFSKVGLLPTPDAARTALNAVAAAYLEKFPAAYKALLLAYVAAGVCAVIAILVDNFVTKAGQFATQLKAADNALTTATLQGLVWAPPPDVVGDLKTPSQRDTCVCPTFSKDRLTGFFTENGGKLRISQGSPLPPLFEEEKTWLKDPIPKSTTTKVSQDEYLTVPSIAAQSSSLNDYETHVITKHEDLADGALDDGHKVMAHDTEFILHFFRLLHKEPERYKNYLIMPNEFHNEKHAGEAILQVSEHILFLYAKLWTQVVKYAPTKWGEVRKAVQAEADAAKATAAKAHNDANDAPALGQDTAAAEAALEQESADAVVAAATAALGVIDGEQAAAHGQAPALEGVTEALAALADGGGGGEEEEEEEGEEEEEEDDDDDDDDDGAAVPAAQVAPEKMDITSVAMLKPLSRGVLRGQVAAHCHGADASTMYKSACINELERVLDLPKSEPKKKKSAAQSAMVNATRLLNTNNHIIQRWCGERMMAGGEGGHVRAKVVARARQVAEARNWVEEGAAEGSVLEAIFEKSAVFKGIFLLIDVEISAVVISMAHWAQGNIEPYLRLFPVLCQIVAADPDTKPNIIRVMHLSLERLVLYNNEHPDVLEMFGRGCLGFRETAIELHHSCLTHIIDKHTGNLDHDNYVRGTCLLGPVRALEQSIVGGFGGKCKDSDMERLKNIKRTLTTAFDATNSALDEFLYAGVGFEEMLEQLEQYGVCSGEYADDKWSEGSRNRLSKGQTNFENAVPKTVAWLEKMEEKEAQDPAQETLLEWLNKKGTTINKVLLPELRRRGLGVSGKKAMLAGRIHEHAKENPGGFINADVKDEDANVGYGKSLSSRPKGFLGVMP